LSENKAFSLIQLNTVQERCLKCSREGCCTENLRCAREYTANWNSVLAP